MSLSLGSLQHFLNIHILVLSFNLLWNHFSRSRSHRFAILFGFLLCFFGFIWTVKFYFYFLWQIRQSTFKFFNWIHDSWFIQSSIIQPCKLSMFDNIVNPILPYSDYHKWCSFNHSNYCFMFFLFQVSESLWISIFKVLHLSENETGELLFYLYFLNTYWKYWYHSSFSNLIEKMENLSSVYLYLISHSILLL